MKRTKTLRQAKKVAKRINKFIYQTIKNYKSMKKDILKILALFLLMISASACNVTRKVTTEQSFFSKGDTAVQITTKTIESYDATKKFK